MPAKDSKLTKLSKGDLNVETSVPAEIVRLKMRGWKVAGNPAPAKQEPAKTVNK